MRHTDAMPLYARTSGRRSRQIASDVCVIAWVVVWWLVSRRVEAAIDAVAEPARRTVEAVSRLRGDFVAAADSAGAMPVAGPDLRRPFDSAATSMDQVVRAGQDQVTSIEQLAFVGGLLVLALPVFLVLALWLPARLRFVRTTRAMWGLVGGRADLELLALRALSTQPLRQLGQISPDPVGDYRAGKWPVVVALADLELGAIGMSVPPDLRQPELAVPDAAENGPAGPDPG